MSVMISSRFGPMRVPPDGKLPCGCIANYRGLTKWNPKCNAHDDPSKPCEHRWLTHERVCAKCGLRASGR